MIPFQVKKQLNRIENKAETLERAVSITLDYPSLQRALLEYVIESTLSGSLDKFENEVERLADEIITGSQSNVNESHPSSLHKQELSIIDLAQYRRRAFFAMDRLETFLSIQDHDSNMIATFKHKFSIFRERSLVDLAIEEASLGNTRSLEILFKRHGNDLLPFRRTILGYIPSTKSLDEYRHLVPTLDSSSRMESAFPVMPWRKPDWCESKSVSEFLAVMNGETELEDEDDQGKDKAPAYPASESVLSEWYLVCTRKLSYQPVLALKWAKLGVSQQLKGFQELISKLKFLTILLHEYYSWTWKEPVSDLDTLDMFIHTDALISRVEELIESSHQKFEQIALNVLTPLVACKNDNVSFESFLWSILSNALSKHSDWTISILQQQSPKVSLPARLCLKLIQQAADTWDVSKTDTLQYMIALLEKMDLSQTPLDQVDNLKHLKKTIRASRILDNFGLALSWKDVDSFIGPDHGTQLTFLRQLCRQSSLATSSNESDWRSAWNDISKMIDMGLFEHLPRSEVISEFVASALGNSQISLVKSILFPKFESGPLNVTEIEVVVLNAAREFFDNAEDPDKRTGLLSKATQVLSILPNSTQVNRELELIEACHTLGAELQIPLDDSSSSFQPIQIRLLEDKLSLVNKALQYHRSLYQSPEDVMNLARNLLGKPEFTKANVQFQLRSLLAEAAILAHDHDVAAHYVSYMIDRSEKDPSFLDAVYHASRPIWMYALELASEDSFDDLGAKLSMIQYALRVCPTKEYRSCARVAAELQLRYQAKRAIEKYAKYSSPSSVYSVKLLSKLLSRTREKDALEPAVETSETLRSQLSEIWSELKDSEDAGTLTFPAFPPPAWNEADGIFGINSQSQDSPLAEVKRNVFEALTCLSRDGSAVNDEILLTLAKLSLRDDFACALISLLHIQEEIHVETFFLDIPAENADIVEQWAAYLFILRAYLPSNPQILNVHPDDVLQYLQTPPQTASPNISTVQMNLELAKRFLSRRQKREVNEQLDELIAIAPNADTSRLLQDDLYRSEQISHAIAYGSSNMVPITLELAKRYGVELESPLTERLKNLFLDEKSQVSDIQLNDSSWNLYARLGESLFYGLCSIHKQVQLIGIERLYFLYLWLRNLGTFVSHGVAGHLDHRIFILETLSHHEYIRTVLSWNQVVGLARHGRDHIVALYKDLDYNAEFSVFVHNVSNHLPQITPLDFLGEANNDFEGTVVMKTDEINSAISYGWAERILAQANWDAMDSFEILDVMKEFQGILPRLVLSDVKPFIYDIVVGSKASHLAVDLRLMILSKAKNLFGDVFQDEARHIDFLNGVSTILDPTDTTDVSPVYIQRLDCLYPPNEEGVTSVLEELLMNGNPTPYHVVHICTFARRFYKFDIEPDSLYKTSFDKLLDQCHDATTSSLENLARFVKRVTSYTVASSQVPEEDEWADGWDVDSDILQETEQISSEQDPLKLLQQGVTDYMQQKLWELLSNQDAIFPAKVKALIADLLEKNFKVNRNETPHMSNARIQHLVSTAWGREMASDTPANVTTDALAFSNWFEPLQKSISTELRLVAAFALLLECQEQDEEGHQLISLTWASCLEAASKAGFAELALYLDVVVRYSSKMPPWFQQSTSSHLQTIADNPTCEAEYMIRSILAADEQFANSAKTRFPYLSPENQPLVNIVQILGILSGYVPDICHDTQALRKIQQFILQYPHPQVKSILMIAAVASLVTARKWTTALSWVGEWYHLSMNAYSGLKGISIAISRFLALEAKCGLLQQKLATLENPFEVQDVFVPHYQNLPLLILDYMMTERLSLNEMMQNALNELDRICPG